MQVLLPPGWPRPKGYANGVTAKGRLVFVAGMEQGILPNKRALDEGNLEEERRLAYVAITRAREQLFLTSARIRSERGEFVITTPSQFLAEALQVGRVWHPSLPLW